LTFAQEQALLHGQAYALAFSAVLFGLCQDVLRADQQATETIAFAEAQGFLMQRGIGWIMHSWAQVEQDKETDLTSMEQGLSLYRVTGAEVGRTHALALQAEVYGKRGNLSEGLRLLGEAFAQVEQSGERFYEAELWRLKGELLLAKASQQAKPGPEPSKRNNK
jgi:predicted ATPase